MEMKEQRSDISNLDDIKLLVDSFYSKVRQDALIGPIFDREIGNNWPTHLEKMYRFWQTILFDAHTYNGRPFPPHAKLPIDKEHFERWLALFESNLDAQFAGPVTEEARFRAHKMAELFQIKLQHIRQDPFRPLL